MAQAWSDRPKDHRWAIIGTFIGMAVAAVVAVSYAFDSSTFVRWLIMSAGLLIGLAAGKGAAALSMRR